MCICASLYAHAHTRKLCSLCSLTYVPLSSLQSGQSPPLHLHCPIYITVGLCDAKYTEGFSALIFLKPSAAFKTVVTISMKRFLLLASVTLYTLGFPSYLSTHNFPLLCNRLSFFSSFLKFSIFLSSILIPLLVSLCTLLSDSFYSHDYKYHLCAENSLATICSGDPFPSSRLCIYQLTRQSS